jgi:hypothetical protein
MKPERAKRRTAAATQAGSSESALPSPPECQGASEGPLTPSLSPPAAPARQRGESDGERVPKAGEGIVQQFNARTGSGNVLPETIPCTVEPITVTVHGVTYRTERTVLFAKPVGELPPSAEAASPGGRTSSGAQIPSGPKRDLGSRGSSPSLGAGGAASAGYVFCKVGRHWKIVYAGATPFLLEDILGARYLDLLLHHPNQPIKAFDLEVAVTPEKGEARAPNSAQPRLDARARSACRQALTEAEAERKEAEQAHDDERATELDVKIQKLEAILKGGARADDTGERARDNVRKAVAVVLQKLEAGGEPERAFAAHIRESVKLGYECLYSQSAGRIWE